MFEQTFKNIDDILHKDAGCGSELDYVEQTSWILFFEKGAPTQNIWFYQLNLDRNLGKTNPLNEQDLADFVSLFEKRAESVEGPETENFYPVVRLIVVTPKKINP